MDLYLLKKMLKQWATAVRCLTQSVKQLIHRGRVEAVRKWGQVEE
jgi:hypothetical protein